MTDIEPGQMDIFEFVDIENDEPKPEPEPRLQNKEEVAPSAGLLPKRKNEKEKALGLLIRINEYHTDKQIAGREFTEWFKASGKKVGDFFTIAEVNEWHNKNKKGAGKS